MRQLAPEQRRQLERIAARGTWTSRAAGASVFVFLLAAIWLGDWRFAATAVLVIPIGIAAAAIAGGARKALARGREET